MVDSIQLGRGRTGVNLIVTASYANRKTIEAAGVELARLLAGRITP